MKRVVLSNKRLHAQEKVQDLILDWGQKLRQKQREKKGQLEVLQGIKDDLSVWSQMTRAEWQATRHSNAQRSEGGGEVRKLIKVRYTERLQCFADCRFDGGWTRPIRVTQLEPGGLAEEAGVRKGDELAFVNGDSHKFKLANADAGDVVQNIEAWPVTFMFACTREEFSTVEARTSVAPNINTTSNTFLTDSSPMIDQAGGGVNGCLTVTGSPSGASRRLRQSIGERGPDGIGTGGTSLQERVGITSSEERAGISSKERPASRPGGSGERVAGNVVRSFDTLFGLSPRCQQWPDGARALRGLPRKPGTQEGVAGPRHNRFQSYAEMLLYDQERLAAIEEGDDSDSKTSMKEKFLTSVHSPKEPQPAAYAPLSARLRPPIMESAVQEVGFAGPLITEFGNSIRRGAAEHSSTEWFHLGAKNCFTLTRASLKRI